MTDLIYSEESYKILGTCMEVYNQMGCGFLESVYHECLEIEFTKQNIPFKSHERLNLDYKDVPLKKGFEADFICFDKIILEIKATSELTTNFEAQTLNYLNATRYKLGLLVNFGEHPKLNYKRIILDKMQRKLPRG